MTIFNRRVNTRKDLYNRLCLVSNIMCFIGVTGIVLMIIENEITFFIGHNEDSVISWFIKLFISISTIVLIGLILYYHQLDMSLYSIKNSINDWRISLTGKRIFLIIIEILICIIHPIPQHFPRSWSLSKPNSTTSDIDESTTVYPSYTTIDILLGLPMFARLYLVCRLMMFHSKLVQNASSQSLSSLNQVSMDFSFLIKTHLEKRPTRCLIIFSSLVFFIGSWSLRACNYKPTSENIPLLDSMWLFIVTFTTVGYGDLIPSTYCGRIVAAIIALKGLFLSALVISVLAQKLVLTRWEKYIYNFVLNMELNKQRKNEAANVIKYAIKVWYLKRKGKEKCMKCIEVQWKLFRSIRTVQGVKQEQRRLIDSCVVLADIFTLQCEGNNKTDKLAQQMNTMNIAIDKIEGTMNNIQNTLNRLLMDRVR